MAVLAELLTIESNATGGFWCWSCIYQIFSLDDLRGTGSICEMRYSKYISGERRLNQFVTLSRGTLRKHQVCADWKR